MGFGVASGVKWKFSEFVEEAEFGPGLPAKTLYLTGKLAPEDGSLKG